MSSDSDSEIEVKDNEQYDSMEHKEHILNVPDTYIGSVEPSVVENVWVCNSENVFINKDIEISTGFFNICNEILTNAADQCPRTREYANKDKTVQTTTTIKVTLNEETNVITVQNDGDGIPVTIHEKKKIYVPELIFGQLLTSSNYNNDKKRRWGGKNGYGAKLCNIYSTLFELETVDHRRGKKFKQVWKNNMSEPEKKAKITKCSDKAYTKITFLPEYSRFGMMNGLEGDIINLIRKRVYDIAGCTPRNVSVYFNGKKLAVKDFPMYVEMYTGKQKDLKRVYEKPNDNWEITACASPDGTFKQVSMVNGICTINGGKHVDYIANKICKDLVKKINGKSGSIKTSHVKSNLWVFINSLIVNPSFSTQTKEELTTPATKFGSKCDLSEDFIKKLAKTEITDRAKLMKSFHDKSGLSKTDGKKTKSIRGIPKLDDANWAGTNKSQQCTLILTEGDSAKSLVLSAIGIIGRDKYGVFPLKGKLLNIRDATVKKISDNVEIQSLKKILGLQQNTKSTKDLRYGRVMIMTDQDLDGYHIKGLLMNMFSCSWEDLLKEGFLVTMYTPLVKVSKGKKVIEHFYNQSDYDQWKDTQLTLKGYDIKYYKGLGTSTKDEAIEYFKNLHVVEYEWDEKSAEMIDLAFNKKKANKRKKWLSHYNKDDVINPLDKTATFENFINKDLIHFSNYDNQRSLPSMCDGFKPSQRKAFHTFVEKNIVKDMKVATTTGYVTTETEYHHGEVSMQETIVGIANDYVGSNNINLFAPKGQFGCIDPNTPVLMWYSTIKKAMYIDVGDQLIGDDGTVREVSKITSGIDDMYEINNGGLDNYIVNSNHIITVSYSGHKSIYWKKSSNAWAMYYFDNESKSIKSKSIKSKSIKTNFETKSNHFNKSKISKKEAYEKLIKFSETIPDNNIFDINIQEYLKLPNYVKHHIKGILNSSVIEWKEQPIDIDPYILGSWLGDGMILSLLRISG